MKIQNHRLVGDFGENIKFVESVNSSAGVYPIYLIIHYTAGTSLSGAVSWFQSPEAKASAHLIIDRDGAVVQMVAFNRRAWHAGKSRWGNLEGMNGYSIGVELVNAGVLEKITQGSGLIGRKKSFLMGK